MLRLHIVLSLLLLAGCARDPGGLPLWRETAVAAPKLQYLGVGGYLLRWRGEALLFAPSFSNPATLGLPPLRVVADDARIDALMPPAADAGMLLVGHAHYDHLLDVPRVLLKHAPQAKVYGSKTMGHILAAVIPRSRIVDAETDMARGLTPGRWFDSPHKRFRVMAIESEHAPHIAGLKFLGGSYTHDLKALPASIWGWKEGQTLAFLVDLLDTQGRPVYRLHYQDAASTPPLGFPPLLPDAKRVDVAILCVGSWNQVPGYPNALLRLLRPRLAVLGHWEDFFGSDPQQPQALRLLDEQGIVAATRSHLPADGRAVMPVPFAEVPLPAPPR
ncbi:MBL fold metallo-hydrolase [Pseudomonas sp. LS44]|uniref:MBL fold metallo-hydrolase n=1 Tax=Pseudomonas sp. LS44 TaxID=1357074 RepID=UPI00215A808F|nr:MBL fold metallo-hydrolase [Pseudomonas sp. LS44]UVE17603.1 MBL fold metallo-hydrolase [Pseudomonas sp. LS44]